MKNNNMSSNPDTKNYLSHDVFTYISYALNPENKTDTRRAASPACRLTSTLRRPLNAGTRPFHVVKLLGMLSAEGNAASSGTPAPSG